MRNYRQASGGSAFGLPSARLLGVLAIAAALWLPASARAAAPSVTETWADQIGGSSALLHAEVSPGGLATGVRFQYLSAASYAANLGAGKDPFAGAAELPPGASLPIPAGAGAVAVPAQKASTLSAATTYRYRLLATNEDGAGVSEPPRSFTTDGPAAAFSLPDGRAWELVSPLDKNGGQIQGPGEIFGGGVIQAAPGGGAITYGSTSSFAGAVGAPGASQYLSRRGEVGWATENITLPSEARAFGDHPNGVPYQLFSPALAEALVMVGHRCDLEPCPRSYTLREGGSGALAALPYEEPDLAFEGASADLSRLFFSTCAELTPHVLEYPGGEVCDGAHAYLYEWSAGALELISSGVSPAPDAHLAAGAGAISADGSRVYWSDLASGSLYLHEAGAPDRLVAPAARFEAASREGSLAYFTAAGHLYRYQLAGESATDLTPGGGVLGVLGASEEGDYVYYAAAGGLFLWHEGTTTPIAPEVDPGSYPPASGSAQLSPDGRHLAFVSEAELTDYDNDAVEEVYLYSAAQGSGEGTVLCASCNPSGERPAGPASLPPANPNGAGAGAYAAYKPRALSVGSGRLFFDSFDALAPKDTNNDRDVYEWEAQGTGSCASAGGCISPISSGTAAGGATFLDASADGSDAYFLTDGSLVKSDLGEVDLYDARVGGGFPEPPDPPRCFGDTCQVLPPEPDDPTPGTQRVGEGDPPLRTGHGRCPKGKVKKKGRCVKRSAHHRKRPSGRAHK